MAIKSRLLFSFSALLLVGVAAAQEATQVEELRSIANEMEIRSKADKEHALYMARMLSLPVRGFTRNGGVYELISFLHGRPNYIRTRNASAAISVGANRLYPGGGLGLNLTGMGLTLGVWDGGVARTTHQEFGGRVIAGDTEPLSADHATHVTGTMVASGVNATAKGMSYQANARSYGWNNEGAEMAMAAANGMRVSNHSYGPDPGWSFNDEANRWRWSGDTTQSQTEDATFGRYEQTALDWDVVAYNAPFYLIVTAAGNDRQQGPEDQPVQHEVFDGNGWVLSNVVRPRDGGAAGFDSISGGGVAKNVMTVGAVDDVLNYTGPASVLMSAFSVWGPIDDGRIKPDICGNGVQVFSTNGGANNAYGNSDGTSMASPNVAGSLGLLVQHHRNVKNNQDMRSATLKALAIHTAKEAGANPGPDYSFGWGLLDVAAAAQVISDSVTNPTRIIQDTLQGTGPKTFTVTTNGQPLRATICWTDPATNPLPPQELDPTTKALVNDLDLRVTSGATTHLPWVLNPANPAAAATRGDNTRDNVEQVLITTAAAGTYTIRVSSKNNPGPNGSQAFSLIVTGATGFATNNNASLQSLTLNPSTVFGGQTTTGTVALTGAAPAGGSNVAIADNSSVITTPDSAMVPAGATTKSFTVNTSDVAASSVRQVTATLGAVTRTATLTINPSCHPTNLVLNPSTVKGGAASTATVFITQIAPAGGVVLNVTDNSSAINTPETVTVPAGARWTTFTVNTMPVGATFTRTVTVTKVGITRSASLTLTP